MLSAHRHRTGSEAELRAEVERARAGEPDAWEWLYRRDYPRLFAYARRRLTSESSAEDAVTETMTWALERIDSFSWHAAGYDAWLFSILRLVVLEQGRSDGRARPVEEVPERETPRDDDPAVVAQSRDRGRMLREAFMRLSEEDREVLELRVVGELDSDQVAAVIGKKPSAVRMAQARALERLGAHVKELEGD